MCLDSLLQALVVQVGQGVQGFQGCQAHHLFLAVQDFPWEKKEDYFLEVTYDHNHKEVRPKSYLTHVRDEKLYRTY